MTHSISRRTGQVLSCAILAFAVAGCPAAKKSTVPAAYQQVQTKVGTLLAGKDCDPLVPTQCGFPFPSNVYLVYDAAKGPSVHFGAHTLPIAREEYTDPTTWNNSDGFSPGQGPMTHLPGATVTGLASPITIELSVAADSPTVLIEADTGRHVPHWAELDQSSNDASPLSERTLIIRPVERLRDAARYIVAIRRVVDATGAAVPPGDVFKALRDGSSSSDPTVEPRRALYADLFQKLKSAGVQQTDLQIAWDYTTATRENNTAALLHMRDEALALVGADGPTYKITKITPNPNKYIRKRIEGTFHVPLYLTEAVPGSRLNRDPVTRLPVQNGWTDYPFLFQIPNSVADSVTNGGPAGAIVEQGHGLLGSRTETENGMFAHLADVNKYVCLAIDLTGFAHDDINTALTAVQGDVKGFLGLVEPQHQGILNELLVMRMAMGAFSRDPEVMYNGHSAIDPTLRFWRGDSQGGIMGTTFMALSTDVTRGYLGEPGMPYNLILNRSLDFGPYLGFIQSTYLAKGGRDVQMILGLIQMLWDRTEPDGYAPYISQNMLPNTPHHDVLINAGLGDFQVTPFGAHIIARAVGAKLVTPVNRHIYGIEEADGPFTGSGITEFNFHLDQNPDVKLPITNLPNSGPDACDPHGKVRQVMPVFMQTDLFFRTGQIRNFCSGATLYPANTPETPGSCDFDPTNQVPPATLPPAAPVACGPG